MRPTTTQIPAKGADAKPMSAGRVAAVAPKPYRSSWDSLLKGINAPDTPQNAGVLSAWHKLEGGSASYNPFNTTLKEPGATSYNSVGVRNYTTPEQGLQATISTLKNTKGVGYDKIISALQSNNPQQALEAITRSGWSGSQYSMKNNDYRTSSVYRTWARENGQVGSDSPFSGATAPAETPSSTPSTSTYSDNSEPAIPKVHSVGFSNGADSSLVAGIGMPATGSVDLSTLLKSRQFPS